MQLTRRTFCCQTAACLTHFAFADALKPTDGYALVARTDRTRIIEAAPRYLELRPRTITSYPTSRSPGGVHDYFSQADYFWPNPEDPGGKYINRDGQSNPGNFNDHRKAMVALSIQMPALTAAWVLTKDRRYGQLAGDHLRAWFINPDTRMNPNLEYSQGVHGVSTGRSYGIIDTLHLVEVARAASIISSTVLTAIEQQALYDWFRAYLHWMKTSEKGIAERDTANNHAICWALQAAEFARLIEDQETREEVRTQYETLFVPNQMALDGSFPRELARTKPYSYSIFNFDTMATLCQSLEGDGPSLYSFVLPDGRGICKAAAFLYPYLQDKNTWPYKQDIEHFASLPVRSPGLLFSGLACHHQEYLRLWTKLNPDPTDPEIIRNFPIRQPLLWVNPPSRSKQKKIMKASRATALSLLLGALLMTAPLAHPQTVQQPAAASPTVEREHVGDAPDDPGPLATDLSPALKPAAIRSAIKKVADWQLRVTEPNFNSQWTFAALYDGLIAASAATGDSRYRQAVIDYATRQQWKLLDDRFPHADDMALGQAYLDLYLADRPKQRKLERIADTKAILDRLIERPDDPAKDLWWWCDALFMAPPVLTRMSVATGDPKYRLFMEREWAITTKSLYDPSRHLYFRDARYLTRKEQNGQPIFWSRGNGWVMGALVKVLQTMPATDPRRPEFVQQFRDMAAEVASIQGQDGLWRSGLLDPDSYPLPEISGSAFFTYAIAYGINEHILDRDKYLPVIQRSWTGMLSHIYADGRLGSIQPIDGQPGIFKPSASYVYGVGGFLLAGAELERLSHEKGLPSNPRE